MNCKVFPILVLAALACALAPRADAGYAKTDLLWKCDFSPEEAARLGVLEKIAKGKGGAAELRPGDGEEGDGALWFRGPAHISFKPGAALSGLVQIEARVRGLDITRLPGAKHFHGPKVGMPYTARDKNGKSVKQWPATPVAFGSFAWTTWVKVLNIPDDAEGLSIHLGLEMTTGEFWVDSLRVWRVEEVSDENVKPPFNAAAAALPRGRFANCPNPKALRGVNFFLSQDKPGRQGVIVDESGEADMAKLESWGANLVRVWIQPNGWTTKEEYVKALKPCVGYAKRMLDAASRHGIKVVLVLGSCPGCKNTRENSLAVLKDFDSQALAKVWERLASCFGGHPALYGYDILNEPGMPAEQWNRVFKEAVTALRKVDPATPVITESFSTYWPPSMRVVYSMHPYQPHDLTHYNAGGSNSVKWRYPGYINGVWWDKEQQRLARKREIEFSAAHPDARILVGEFSCILWADGAEKWIADAIDLYDEYGWDWCYHAYGSGYSGWNVEVDHDAKLTPGKWVVPDADTARKKVLLKGLSRNKTTRKGIRK